MSFTVDPHALQARPPSVGPDLLRRDCAPAEVPWQSTRAVEPHRGVFGQHRAFGAVQARHGQAVADQRGHRCRAG